MATNKMIPRPTTKLHKNVSPDVNTSMDQRSFPNTRINAAWVPDKSRPSCNLPNTEPRKTNRATIPGKCFDLQQVHDEFVKAKEQLGLLEKSKSNLMHDLTRAKKNVNQLTVKLHGTNETSKVLARSTADGTQQGAFPYLQADQFLYQEWRVELERMKEQYEGALIELQSNKQALESLKHELIICVEAKDEAVRLAGEAMNAAESTAKRVEELSGELLIKGKGHDNTASPHLNSDTRVVDTNIDKLAVSRLGHDHMKDAMAEIEILKRELAQVKASEAHLKSQLGVSLEERLCSASPKDAIKKDNLEIQMAIQVAESEVTICETNTGKSIELLLHKALEEAQGVTLSKALEGSLLSSCLEFLKAELEQTQEELLALKVNNRALLCEALEKEEAQLGVLLAVLSELEMKAKDPDNNHHLINNFNDVQASYVEKQQLLLEVLEEALEAVAEHQARCRRSRQKYAMNTQLHHESSHKLENPDREIYDLDDINEVETLRTRLYEAQAEAKEVSDACNNAQRKLKEALIEIEALRSCKYSGDEKMIKKHKLALCSCIGNWIP